MKEMKTKKDILASLENAKHKLFNYIKEDRQKTASYLFELSRLFDEFTEKVKKAELMERLEGNWQYRLLLTEQGFILELRSGPLIKENATCFQLIKTKPTMLTVENYAKLNNVETSTVRSWIRRGKIRTAKKYGNEWKIPSLADKPQRGYTTAEYSRNVLIDGIPEEYSFINQGECIRLMQDVEDKKKYHIKVYKNADSHKPIFESIVNKLEIERLEVFLIGHEDIEYVDTRLKGVHF